MRWPHQSRQDTTRRGCGRARDDNGAEIIRVVDLDRGVERPATPDEIERGVFYTSYENYKEGKVA